jgi:putative DNA primase/helicase
MPVLLRQWLPDGRQRGREYWARNPARNDRRPRSFAVNLINGQWSDFAEGAKGGDVVSLYVLGAPS